MAESSLETAAPPAGRVVAGWFDREDDYEVVRSYGTRDWLITFTLHGQGQYWLGEHTTRCHQGDIVVLPPNVPHHYGTAAGRRWEFHWAHFLPRMRWESYLAELIPDKMALCVMHVEGSDADRVRNAFSRLGSDAQVSDSLAEELALNALEEIVLLLLAGKRRETAVRGLDPRVAEVMNYIAAHYAEPITIEHLSTRVRLSPSRLSHLYKAQVGESMVSTVVRLRLGQAARLLQLSSLGIGEIATSVGFASPYYFSRAFARQYGMSPTLFRKVAERPHDVNRAHNE